MKSVVLSVSETVFVLIFSMVAPELFAAELSCEIANELAGKSYTRTADAKNSGNLIAAHQHKLAFWDVFQYGSHCTDVKRMALQLSTNKLGSGDDPPSGQEALRSIAGVGGLNLPSTCFNGGTLACRIIITEPAKSNTEGADGNPNFYILDESSISPKLPTTPAWKKFSGTRIELPTIGDFKK